MRARGVRNFPDLPSGGKYPTPQDLGVSSTSFQTAYNDCKRLLPNSDASPVQASPKLLNEVLKFARCMRSHGRPPYHADPQMRPLVPAVPDFQLSAAPVTESVTAGSAASYPTTIGAINGFTGTVGLSVAGLPAGAAGFFNPALISGAGSSVLNVSTTSAITPGTYPLTITGTSGTVVHAATVALVVNPAPLPDFALSALPGSQAVVAGSGTSYTVGVSGFNGFSGSVALSVSGLPAGVSGSFSAGTITGSGASTLSVTTAASAPAGTYVLTITGISGSLSHSTTVDLTINPDPDFTVSVTPSSQSVRKGGTVAYTVTVTPENNFGGTVTLALASSPVGPGGTFTPSALTSGTSALTVNSGNKAGTFTLTVTASSGSTIHTATATLTVTTH